MNENDKNILTDEQLDNLVEAAAEAREENEKADAYTVDEIEAIAKPFEEAVEKFEAGEGVEHTDDEEIEVSDKILSKNAIEGFKLEEEELLNFMTLVGEYKKNKNIRVYPSLPANIQKTVHEVCKKYGLNFKHYEEIAKTIIDEFISDSEVDAAFSELEDTMAEAGRLPSILDMYSEHAKSIMDKNVPEIIENIKEEFPDKARALEELREYFYHAVKLDLAREEYKNNARLRKAIRRFDTEYDKVIDEFNYKVSKTSFKNPDACEIVPSLMETLVYHPQMIATTYMDNREEIPELYATILDMKISESDLKKFAILICKSCENLDYNNNAHAAYLFYLVKNMVSLRFTQEGKTDFAVELINNICDTITFIRNEEADFNAEHLHESKHSKKLHSGKSRKG